MEINLTNKRIERIKTCNITILRMKIKLKKEMSETCLVYRLYLIRTIQKYNSSKRSSLKHTLEKKKKTAHAYFGRLYFSKFFGGKITPF